MRGAQEAGQRRWRTAASRRSGRVHEGPPSGQNARLRGGKAKETEGVTLVSTRHRAPQFPLPPYTSWLFQLGSPADHDREWDISLQGLLLEKESMAIRSDIVVVRRRVGGEEDRG